MGAATPAFASPLVESASFTLREYEPEPLSGIKQHYGEGIAYAVVAIATPAAQRASRAPIGGRR